jgi:hypothetical protein
MSTRFIAPLSSAGVETFAEKPRTYDGVAPSSFFAEGVDYD